MLVPVSLRPFTGRSVRLFSKLQPQFIIALIACLSLLSITSLSQASSKVSVLRLIVGGQYLSVRSSAVGDASEIYAPLSILKIVGANARISGRGDAVVVTEEVTGRSLELAIARVNGIQMIALSDLAHVVDGAVIRPLYSKRTKPLDYDAIFAAKLTALSRDTQSGRIRIETSFPVKYRIEPSTINSKISVVECIGLTIDGYIPPSTLPGVRVDDKLPGVMRFDIDNRVGMILASVSDGSAAAKHVSFEYRPAPVVPLDKTKLIAGQNAIAGGGRVSADVPVDPVLDTIIGPIDISGQPVQLANKNSMPTNAISSVSQRHDKPVTPTKIVITNAGRTGTARQTTPTVVVHPAEQNKPASNNTFEGPPNKELVKLEYPTPANTADLEITAAGGARSPHLIPSKQVEIRSLSFVTDNTQRAHIELGVTGKATATVRYIPGTTQMELLVSNASLRLPSDDNGERDIQNLLVTHMSISDTSDSKRGTLLQIDTSRIVGYTITSLPDKLMLDLRIPRNATGALSDKLIVVDAGHGGNAAGAAGRGAEGTVYEKNLTLAIALKLRTFLEQAGARVVMTRDSDTDVGLYDRSKLANTIGADLFISIHNDSTPHPGSASGTTTYFHNTDPSSRVLAECVQDCVHSISGIPGKGAHSDTVLWPTGLAVLRTTNMPAVLCEVAYINNSKDRSRLVDPAFQSRVAQAMCDGLRGYVEGRFRSALPGVAPFETTPDSVPSTPTEP